MSDILQSEIKNEDNIFLFKCIVDFIHCLRDLYGEKQHSLKLYDLLMEKTGIVHEEPIQKHVHIFYHFVKENEEGILENDVSFFKEFKIEYSEKVFIDFKPIFDEISSDDKECLWEHLLTLLAVIIPTSKAKKILTDRKKKGKEKKNETGTNEDNFLTNVMEKVGRQIDPSQVSDPSQMMTNIMSSGVFTELMSDMNSGMTNGDLDINKMMGSLQGMIGNLSTMLDNANKSS